MHKTPEEIKAYAAQLLEEKIDFSTNAKFSIEVKPHTKQHIDFLTIDIKGGPGWYHFSTIPDLSIASINSLHVREGWRGQKIGRSLVETSESLCASIGIETMIIGENANDAFWSRQGYEPVQDSEPYRALARKGIFRYREHVEKLSIALMKRL